MNQIVIIKRLIARIITNGLFAPITISNNKLKGKNVAEIAKIFVKRPREPWLTSIVDPKRNTQKAGINKGAHNIRRIRTSIEFTSICCKA